jgi:hypothetical protein
MDAWVAQPKPRLDAWIGDLGVDPYTEVTEA